MRKKDVHSSAPSLFKTSLVIAAASTVFLLMADAQAQRYRSRCQTPQTPYCVKQRNMDDRQLQQCQFRLRDFERTVQRYQDCLKQDYRTTERDLKKTTERLQAIENEQKQSQSIIRNAHAQLSCTLSGRNYCR